MDYRFGGEGVLKMKRYSVGQVTLEFTFCLIIVILLMYGMIQVLSWIGMTLTERRAKSEQSLTSFTAVENWRDPNRDPSPLTQLQTDFYTSKKMKLVFNQW